MCIVLTDLPKFILTGCKDLSSNLWTLPICQEEQGTTLGLVKPTRLRPGPCIGCAPLLLRTAAIAGFSYHWTTKENDVKFMHQRLCNPFISSLRHAIQQGFLKGTPHLNAKMVCKYLMPSPATSKGHMKCPRKGLHSTTMEHS